MGVLIDYLRNHLILLTRNNQSDETQLYKSH